jgi:hypothetical protein
MRANLDTLKDEILEHLRAQGFVTFHGLSRLVSSKNPVSWDTRRHPDYKAFLAAAAHLGVKLVAFHYQEFQEGEIDDALDRLEDAGMDPDEQRSLQRRLGEMRVYQGLVSGIELSFDHDGRTYLFNVFTDWCLEFMSVNDQIDSYLPDEDEEEDEEPLGGYFSRN